MNLYGKIKKSWVVVERPRKMTQGKKKVVFRKKC